MILGGFGMYAFSKMFPPIPEAMLMIITFETLGLIMLIIPAILLLYGVYRNHLIWNLEELPKNKLLIWFLRRDGSIVPVLGSRAYPGESFIDVPKLGLIHDLGKGSVYRIGKNPVRFALENVNHTPNPAYANFTNWLYNIGFNSLSEIKNTIKGEQGFADKRVEVEDRMAEFKPLVDKLEDEIKAEKEEKKFDMQEHEEISSIVDRIVPKAFKNE
jgi:hypothetical protein